MKIITLQSSFILILSIIAIGNLAIVQSTLAENYVFDFNQKTSSSVNDLANTPLFQTTNVDTFDWSSAPSYSKAEMTDVLTASFTNIIDAQIYTGLESTTLN